MQYLITTVFIFLCCMQVQAQDKTLRFYNWNDYMVPEVLADFTKETGIKVQTPIYTSMAEMLNVVRGGEALDLLVPSHFVLPTLIDEGLVQPLDKSKLPNLAYSGGRLMVHFNAFDPQRQYAAPYLWGTIGLAVNRPKVEAALGSRVPQSWDILFDPAISRRLAGCGMTTLDAPNEMLSILLNYKGLSLDRSSIRRIRQAAVPVLDTLRPHLRYADGERYIRDLAEGKLCVAVSRMGDALRAREAGQPVDFFIPKEGSAMFLDSLVIPANSVNPELAHELINYLMRPEIAARLTEGLFYGNFNTEAAQFLPADLAENPMFNPDSADLRRLYVLSTLSAEKEALRDEIWSRFVKGTAQ
ncbi:hypothetical protein AXE65_09130 [Ventosimonas gracilis]|uniref:Putrescine-binding periplasmic protein n=1 Tax=Ventosimonas gracilis TaxID=1680762 RepID=A0A139SXK3_9GAMM|nr:extracellular solute-binding protein [Ventosimonas gracilis]KXU39353.1 hypothetical protein AXE65_09130 [Ventosimonas gracilis]